MAMVSNLDLIRRVPLFSMLTDVQASLVADAVVKRRYRRGENIVEQGKKSNALFIMLTGRARVVSTDSRGREVILATLRSGDHVGEMSQVTWAAVATHIPPHAAKAAGTRRRSTGGSRTGSDTDARRDLCVALRTDAVDLL